MTTHRPAVGSLYLRPNGEAWRWVSAFRGKCWYVMDAEGYGDYGNRDTDDLPDDAELIWSPPHE